MIQISIGIDPGIVDTAIVAACFDTDQKKFWHYIKVWNNVTSRKKNVVIIDEKYLEELKDFVVTRQALTSRVRVYIEGFAQRGRDIHQDQRMLALVRETHKAIKHSEVLENTSMKKIVTEDMLRITSLQKFKVATNHSDIKSAARVALRGMINEDDTNLILADLVRDYLDGVPWSHESTVIL